MNVIIAGSRSFNTEEDCLFLKRKCYKILKDEDSVTIFSGGANGADLFGEVFALDYYYDLRVFLLNGMI